MARIPLVLLALSCLVYPAFGVDIRGKIQWTDVCTGPEALGHAKVVLDNGRFSGGIVHDGSFTIPDITPGTYVLSVRSHDFTFDQLRVDILASSSDPEIRPYIPGTPLNPPSTVLLGYPITLPVRQKNAYFIPRESFNLVAMFQNPMMLLMVFGGGMMLAMPYVIKNLDPELMQEVQNVQAKRSVQPSFEPKSIKPRADDDSTSGGTTRSQAGTNKTRSGKNKKRG